MMPTGMLRSRSIGLLATLVAVVVPAILAGPAIGAKLKIYDLPKSLNYAAEIVAAPDGALWFTQNAVNGPRGQHVLGRITPAGAISTVALPAGARAKSPAVGLDGGLWFADYGFWDAPRLLRFGAGGERREIVLAGDWPATAVAAAPDGAIWFSTFERMGRLAVDGSVTSFGLTAESHNLAAGSDGAMWIGMFGQIVRLDASGATRVFRLPIELSPEDLISGSDGALWFSAGLCACIVRMTTTGQRRIFRLPQAPDFAGQLASAPDGAIWFTHALGLGRIAITGEFTLFDVPRPRAHYRFAQDVAAGSDGAMWFTLQDSPLEPLDAKPDASAIGRLDFSGANAAKLLVARLAGGQLRGRAGGILPVPFETTRRAGGALVVVRTKPGVDGWRELARTRIRPGAHSAALRLPRRPGTYRVMLRLRVASQTASDSASVRVSRARKRPPGPR